MVTLRRSKAQKPVNHAQICLFLIGGANKYRQQDDPFGEKQKRRAIQLGLRDSAIESYVHDWILDISDISEFVSEQRKIVESGNLDLLHTPKELVYLPTDKSLHKKLGLEVP